MEINNSTLLSLTQSYDPTQIRELETDSEEFKEFLVQLYLTTNDILSNLNLKDSGQYGKTKSISGQQYFPNPADPANALRSSVRVAFDMPGLVNNGTTVVNLADFGVVFDNKVTFVNHRVIATSSTSLLSFSLNFYDGANIARYRITQTQVIITTVGIFNAFDKVQVVLEYIID